VALSTDQVENYRRDGYLHPIRVMSEERARSYRAKLEALEAERGGALDGDIRFKTYLLQTWLDELIRDPAILDPIEQVIGPDILCWSTDLFIKEAHTTAYVSWHQDATYWGLEPPEIVTAWLALSPSTRESGCLRVVPGTHARGQVEHVDRGGEDNMLSRGQEIEVDADESEAVDIELSPGEMSLHHVLLFHSSEPNRSDDRRLGIAVRYLPAYVRQHGPSRESAMLVRGVDEHGNFDLEPRPKADMDEAAVAAHRDAMRRFDESGSFKPAPAAGAG
jgi:non-haem Fe2+, alpha-ketoglutarate-dependent halogenase